MNKNSKELQQLKEAYGDGRISYKDTLSSLIAITKDLNKAHNIIDQWEQELFPYYMGG